MTRIVRSMFLVAVGASIFSSVKATEYDLSPAGSQSFNVPGDVGGTAIVRDYMTQPAGTGVFKPFLTIDANGQTSTGLNTEEQGYNTDGFSAMYLDQLRPQWNNRMTFGSLVPQTINGQSYYGFLLDANEPGGNKSTISVDNIRIYTSGSDNTASVGNNIANLGNLGTLRWALNDPTTTASGAFKINNWIKLDASQENVDGGASQSNGGSGKSDMVIYIPASAFTGANATDYVWFYNLNGVHYSIDSNLATTSGYEEWSRLTVPDGGSTAMLLGAGLVGLVAVARRRAA